MLPLPVSECAQHHYGGDIQADGQQDTSERLPPQGLLHAAYKLQC